MNALEAALRRIAADLDLHHRQWALVGGFAVSARAEPRFTRDIDAVVMVSDDTDSEGLVGSLLASRYRLLASVDQDETGRLATVRLACPVGDGNIVVDLLFASSGIEPEITQAAEITEIVPGLSLPIATTGHLIALKLLARDDQTRPQDLMDLRVLMEVATAADLSVARESVQVISERGYDRGRNLKAALEEAEKIAHSVKSEREPERG